MTNSEITNDATTTPRPLCQSIDWYAEGQSRIVEVDGVRITVRFIGRKGRRGRIAIEAPAGAVFCSPSGGTIDPLLPTNSLYPGA